MIKQKGKASKTGGLITGWRLDRLGGYEEPSLMAVVVRIPITVPIAGGFSHCPCQVNLLDIKDVPTTWRDVRFLLQSVVKEMGK
ncbi:hypothetical protein ACFLX4_00295 [Chloroflexota bacterium]